MSAKTSGHTHGMLEHTNWPHELGTALLSEQTDLHPWSAFVVHKEYGDDLGCLDQEAHRVHQIRKERPSPHPKRVILHDNPPDHEPGGHYIYERAWGFESRKMQG